MGNKAFAKVLRTYYQYTVNDFDGLEPYTSIQYDTLAFALNTYCVAHNVKLSSVKFDVTLINVNELDNELIKLVNTNGNTFNLDMLSLGPQGCASASNDTTLFDSIMLQLSMQACLAYYALWAQLPNG